LGFKIDDEDPLPVAIVNPAFVVKGWGRKGVDVKVDGETLETGESLCVGYETTHSGTDLVLWFKMKSDKQVKFSLTPE
jgi:hypothetical protein